MYYLIAHNCDLEFDAIKNALKRFECRDKLSKVKNKILNFAFKIFRMKLENLPNLKYLQIFSSVLVGRVPLL